jgi:hypothetical protein
MTAIKSHVNVSDIPYFKNMEYLDTYAIPVVGGKLIKQVKRLMI